MVQGSLGHPAISERHAESGDPVHALPDGASEITQMESEKFEPIRREPTIEDVVNLPLRSLSNDANLNEYTQETIDGQMLREVRSSATGRIERYELVTFKIGDPENPKNWSKVLSASLSTSHTISNRVSGIQMVVYYVCCNDLLCRGVQLRCHYCRP